MLAVGHPPCLRPLSASVHGEKRQRFRSQRRDNIRRVVSVRNALGVADLDVEFNVEGAHMNSL